MADATNLNRVSYYDEDDLEVKNGEEQVNMHKDVVATDKEAPEDRKNGPAPDEEAYVTDELAPQRRNIEPAPDEDEPLQQKNGLKPDEEAPPYRNNQPMGSE